MNFPEGTLFNWAGDVAHFRYLLVSFDFSVSQLGRGRVFAHDAIGDFVVGEEIAVGQASVALVGIDDFDWFVGMAAEDRAILEEVGIMDRGRAVDGGRWPPKVGQPDGANKL